MGHRVTAMIAYRHLNPVVRARIDAFVADPPRGEAAQQLVIGLAKADGADLDDGDSDRALLQRLQDHSFEEWSTWADRVRPFYERSSSWHFMQMDLKRPGTIVESCRGQPQDASPFEGATEDCLVNKIYQLANTVRDASASEAQRIVALKFLVHLVADLHSPVHVADNQDRGGNCVRVMLRDRGQRMILKAPGRRPLRANERMSLHAYWDSALVAGLGPSAEEIAARLDAGITPADIEAWSADVRQGLNGGDRPWAADWALESYKVAREVAYALPTLPTCDVGGDRVVELSREYQEAASAAGARRLQMAAIRIASLLNQLLASPS